MVSLGVPYRHRRRERRLCGLERQPIGDPLAFRKTPDVRYVALQGERGLQVLVDGVAFVPCRVQTVEGYTGTNAVVVRGGVPEGAGGVRCVHEHAPEVLRGEHRLEEG